MSDRRYLVLLSVLLSSACYRGCIQPGVDPARERAAWHDVFSQPAPLGEPCQSRPPKPARHGATEQAPIIVDVYYSRSLSAGVARDALASLPAFYWPYGVRFARGKTTRVDAVDAFGGTGAQGEQAVRDSVAPLKRLMQTIAIPKRERTINVVVLRHLTAKLSPLRRVFSGFHGLSLAPQLRTPDDPLYRALQLPKDFTPTILLSVEERPKGIDLTAAHEFGHLAGLEHEQGHRLMSTKPLSCVPTLSEAALKKVRALFR